ncbi:MAG: RNA polymerase sigma factor [Eubacteriaceae bacterium]|nr:RNA polymerase sigma factor [Eubacteriaceae bacterium]
MAEQKIPSELNKNSFKAYYEKYAEKALRVAAAVVRSDAAAADVVHEAFLRVYLNMHKFDNTKSFEPWFYRILINECRRAYRKINEAAPIEEYQNLAEPVKSEYDFLYEAIGQLKKSQRIPIILRYLSGYSDKEVALILRLNLTTVKARIKRGKEKLRLILQKEND